MEDLKKHIFPLIAAIAIHGFLVGFKMPKQQTLKPALRGDPIKIELNAFSPKVNVPHNLASKKEQIIQKEISQKKAVQKVVQKEVISQPIVIAKRHKKIVRVQKQKEQKVIIKDSTEKIELQNRDFHELPSDNVYENRLKENKLPLLIRKKAIPIYRHNTQPPYPVMAKRRGYEGEVLLSVLVDAVGIVAEIKIKHSSGYLSLDRAALTTLKSWSFTPATEDGRPVAMWVDVPIAFQLK